jgi:hypothetical protein
MPASTFAHFGNPSATADAHYTSCTALRKRHDVCATLASWWSVASSVASIAKVRSTSEGLAIGHDQARLGLQLALTLFQTHTQQSSGHPPAKPGILRACINHIRRTAAYHRKFNSCLGKLCRMCACAIRPCWSAIANCNSLVLPQGQC